MHLLWPHASRLCWRIGWAALARSAVQGTATQLRRHVCLSLSEAVACQWVFACVYEIVHGLCPWAHSKLIAAASVYSPVTAEHVRTFIRE